MTDNRVPLRSQWVAEVWPVGEPRHVARVEITRVHDGWVSGRVVRGRGVRKGRIYSDAIEAFLARWQRVS